MPIRISSVSSAITSRGQGNFFTAAQKAILIQRGTKELSQVPGQSQFRICPALRPRPGRSSRHYGLTVPSPLNQRRGPSATKSFGAQSHGFCGRCLRFALRSPSCARLASDFPSRFIGWDFHPQDCSREFQTFTVLLTLQVYPGAMAHSFLPANFIAEADNCSSERLAHLVLPSTSVAKGVAHSI
jgi:hypothetical protein